MRFNKYIRNDSSLVWHLVFYALLIFGIFGWSYNIIQINEQQEFIGFIVDAILLSYTNFLAYPFLAFVLYADKKKGYLWFNNSAGEWLFFYMFSPIGVAVGIWCVKLVNFIWRN